MLINLGGRENVMVWNAPTGLFEVNGRKVNVGPKGRADIQGIIRLAVSPQNRLRAGLAFAVEIKTGSGKLKPEQKRWRDRFVELGGLYLVVRDIATVDQVFSSRFFMEAFAASETHHE